MSIYSQGRNFEYTVAKKYRKQGFFVIRSAGSHTPADLIAIKQSEIHFIQAKASTSNASPKERIELIQLASWANQAKTIPIIANKKKNGRIQFKEIIFPDLPKKPGRLCNFINNDGKRCDKKFIPITKHNFRCENHLKSDGQKKMLENRASKNKGALML